MHKKKFRREIRKIMEANNYQYIGTVFEDSQQNWRFFSFLMRIFVPENFKRNPGVAIDDIFLRNDKVN